MKVFRALLIILVACTPAFSPAADSTEQQLSRLLADWGDALVKQDREFLAKVLAAEFQGVDELGAVFTRDQYLATMTSGDQVVKSVKIVDDSVRGYGKYAVLTTLYTIEAVYKGKEESGTYRSTLVFAKRDGRWQCVAGHTSVVAPQT
ncbi:MAG TPA: nuclear transport factor 2 family protein [Steroidobacteraceae bacterium]|jgi:ketosteroid isomerase-like protein|nr:nuclear transport factor 2 family protein [Steroidobacteraceae bacterium]